MALPRLAASTTALYLPLWLPLACFAAAGICCRARAPAAHATARCRAHFYWRAARKFSRAMKNMAGVFAFRCCRTVSWKFLCFVLLWKPSPETFGNRNSFTFCAFCAFSHAFCILRQTSAARAALAWRRGGDALAHLLSICLKTCHLS